MIRDTIKSKEYFEEFLKTSAKLIEFNNISLSQGKVHESKVNWAKYRNLNYYIESIIAKYSLGVNLIELRQSIKNIIQLLPDLWIPICTKVKDSEGKLYDMYMLSSYERLLNILSISCVLEVPDQEFQILVDIIY